MKHITANDPGLAWLEQLCESVPDTPAPLAGIDAADAGNDKTRLVARVKRPDVPAPIIQMGASKKPGPKLAKILASPPGCGQVVTVRARPRPQVTVRARPRPKNPQYPAQRPAPQCAPDRGPDYYFMLGLMD